MWSVESEYSSAQLGVSITVGQPCVFSGRVQLDERRYKRMQERVLCPFTAMVRCFYLTIEQAVQLVVMMAAVDVARPV
jgi:hypothetical protein